MSEKIGNILCVDDEPGILRSLKWLLQKQFNVTTATSGQEGLALVREHDFDVIVSDQRMPGMTGVEFLKEACRISPRSMRILLTGYSDLDAVTRSVNESEVFRFVNKPWHVDELPLVIAEAAHIAQSHPAPTPVAATEAAAGAAPAQAEAPADAKPETLLVIDDDPQLPEVLRQAVGAGTAITHAGCLAEAVDILASENSVGLVVSDTHVGGSDATRLLKLLKERCPDIVTVAFSGQLDAQEIISLINQGQVYRFVQKPVKPGYLKLVMTSAMLKRQQLRSRPEFAKRHAVQKMDGSLRDAFAHDVQRLAQAPARPSASRSAGNGVPWLQRVTSGLRVLFG